MQEPVRPDYILACIRSHNHVVWVAQEDKTLVGFVDCFMTISQNGTRRWEIDLLAVHPRYQGQGIGTALVRAGYDSGKEHGAGKARALVQAENAGSQRTFARCGFVPQDTICRLCVASLSNENVEAGNMAGLHLIAVQTFSYRGLWLEGTLNAKTLNAGMAECVRRRVDLAGAVIPLHQPEAVSVAEQLGFEPVGVYQWWIR
jgi:GNAT superfamily N-acetyltransferase